MFERTPTDSLMWHKGLNGGSLWVFRSGGETIGIVVITFAKKYGHYNLDNLSIIT